MVSSLLSSRPREGGHVVASEDRLRTSSGPPPNDGSTRVASPTSVHPSAVAAPSFEDYVGALYLCCDHALAATEGGRLSASHGLFQTALRLFEQAQRLADEGEASVEKQHLIRKARERLEFCATTIYSEDHQKAGYERPGALYPHDIWPTDT